MFLLSFYFDLYGIQASIRYEHLEEITEIKLLIRPRSDLVPVPGLCARALK